MSIMTSRNNATAVRCRYCSKEYSKTGILSHERTHPEFFGDADNKAHVPAKHVPEKAVQESRIEVVTVDVDSSDLFDVCLKWFPKDPLLLAVMSSLRLMAMGEGEKISHLKDVQTLIDMSMKKETSITQGVYPPRT